MALNLIKQIKLFGQRSLITKTLSAKFYTGSLFEPDYLETGKSKIPILSTINVQIRGYDYPILESYQTFIQKLTDIMQIDVDNSWALPPQTFNIQRYKTGTTVILSEFNLNIYERNMQISEVSTTKCSILIRALEATLPQGITMNIDIYNPNIEEKRYVPDKQLKDLKASLDSLKKK